VSNSSPKQPPPLPHSLVSLLKGFRFYQKSYIFTLYVYIYILHIYIYILHIYT
jgi:hypothetical protein